MEEAFRRHFQETKIYVDPEHFVWKWYAIAYAFFGAICLNICWLSQRIQLLSDPGSCGVDVPRLWHY